MHLHNNILKKEVIPEFILECLAVDDKCHHEFGNCISGILCQMEDRKRELLISNLANQLSSINDGENMISKIFIYSPFTKNTWNNLGKQSEEIQNAYWSKVYPNWRDSEDLNFAVTKFLEVERTLVAFHLARYELETVESKSILVLLNAIATNTSNNDRNYKPSKYDIEQALKTLNERDDFDRMELVKLEYLYVDMLHSHSRYGIPNLAKEVSESPLSFMQLVAYSFKRRGNGRDPDEWNMQQDGEARRIAATKAYHVLECLNVIPGTEKDSSVNIGKLREWVLQVRRLAKEHGRANIADQQIGRLLSTSLEGDDGIWPMEEIRIVFEEIGSDEISIGMETGLSNSAGAEFREVDSSRERSKCQ